MKNFHEARLAMYSIGLFFSSVLERIITYTINIYLGSVFYMDLFSYNPIYYHTLSLIILIILFIVISSVLKPSIKRIVNTKFFGKINLGNEYIGGRWVELVLKGTVIFSYCLLDITYNSGNLEIAGSNYNSDFRMTNRFFSKHVSFENYVLSYLYEEKDLLIENNKVPLTSGQGRLMFQPKVKNSPNMFFGEFEKNDERFYVYGYMQNKKNITALDNDFDAEFKRIVSELRTKIPQISQQHDSRVHAGIAATEFS